MRLFHIISVSISRFCPPLPGRHALGETLTDYIQVSWGGSILSTCRIMGKINQMSES